MELPKDIIQEIWSYDPYISQTGRTQAYGLSLQDLGSILQNFGVDPIEILSVEVLRLREQSKNSYLEKISTLLEKFGKESPGNIWSIFLIDSGEFENNEDSTRNSEDSSESSDDGTDNRGATNIKNRKDSSESDEELNLQETTTLKIFLEQNYPTSYPVAEEISKIFRKSFNPSQILDLKIGYEDDYRRDNGGAYVALETYLPTGRRIFDNLVDLSSKKKEFSSLQVGYN